jgi:hypothetical protein
MRKPTLSTLAQLADIMAAVAVVISLVYVGRELRLNTTAIRGAAQQSITATQADIVLLEVSDSAVARIREIGDANPSDLTETESARYRHLLRQIWVNLENVYFQNDLGLIDPRLWDVNHRTICQIWSAPGARATWPDHRAVLDAEFVALVESCPQNQ